MLPDVPAEPPLPPAPPLPPVTPSITLSDRIVALLEVLICSDYPTQLAVAATLTSLGYAPFSPDGRLHAGYVVAMSLIDAVALISLILLFLRSHGESPREVFLGRRSVVVEAMHGIPLMFFAFLIASVSLLTIQRYAPSLHTVEQNPLQELLSRPRDAWLFALVVVVAGGIREEIQRAFLLHRFERWLGGGTVGVIVTSVASANALSSASSPFNLSRERRRYNTERSSIKSVIGRVALSSS